MEISAQNDHELDAVETSIASTLQRLCHLRQRRNFLASPLLHLPTELILKVFVHAIALDDDGSAFPPDNGPTLLVLIATCHQLREIGIASPQLWSTVDLTIPPIAELFLERCHYDPRTLIKCRSVSERRSMYLVSGPGREAVWDRLEGRTLNNLHSVVFEGLPHEFTRRIASVLQRAPNVSCLDLHNIWARPNVELPWPPGDPMPKLSTLRLRNFLISWASPFLRNLRQLTLEAVPPPSEHTSIDMFLAVLADSPNLEVLHLAHTGPDLPNDHRDNCDAVVQLRKLRRIFLEFRDPPRVGYILSHIEYPESAYLGVVIPLGADTDPAETISQALPRRKTGTVQQSHLGRPADLAVRLDSELLFYTDDLFVQLQNRRGLVRQIKPQAFTSFASKVVEVIRRDPIVSLTVTIQHVDPTDEMWEVFLHGLPRLERICYELDRKKGDPNHIDPFILAFSRPFEEGPVCPQLQHLELPRVVLSQSPSDSVLVCTLAKRDACGTRLKRIGLSGDTAERGDRLVLDPFRCLVDEVQ